jgi:hypothetical protein
MRLIAATILSLVPAMVQAADGNQLHELCRSGDAVYYVSGLVDGLILTNSAKNLCIPRSATTGQLKDVVCKYVRDNPQLRHQQAPALTYSSMRSSFCSE